MEQNNTLADVWGQVTSYLSKNINIIPVRDKDEKMSSGDILPAKTPLGSWKRFQTEKITEAELWATMEEKDTTAIAIVCGQISGNLEVIDIDVKYKPGIDAILFNDLRTFYPSLYSRLRIHRTPSGGYHIPYRVVDKPVPGNLKLAGREATHDEIELQKQKGRKRISKEVNFLETRGEGGYILAPPSLGYSVHKDNPIPDLTWEERCSIITLCETYNEIIKEEPRPKPTKTQDSYYSENPFEHFNNEINPTELIETFGWKFSHENKTFIWYTRPDKQTGVSASWNKVKKIYYVFTSSTELMPSRGYHASTLLAELLYGGDKKETFKHLVREGYGKVKKSIEEKIIKKAVINGNEIPKNFSEDAKKTFENLKISYSEDYPLGVFWKVDHEDKITIDKWELKEFMSRNGIYRYRITLERWILIKIENQIVKEVNKADIKKIVSDYLEACDEMQVYQYVADNVTKTFANDWFEMIEEANIQFKKDDRESINVFFRNGFLHINKDGYKLNPYNELDGNIWDSQILKRDFTEKKDSPGDFEQFVWNISGKEPERYKSICTSLGYLMHDYKNLAQSPAIIFNDEVISDNPEGGTGKGILIKAIKNFKNTVSFDGKTFSFDKSFVYQRIDLDTKVMAFEDVNKNFDFERLFSVITDGIEVEKKNMGTFMIDFMDSPKIIITTNYALKGAGNSHDRRRFEIELSRYYTADFTPLDEFKRLLFAEWDKEEWGRFDTYMAECASLFLTLGLVKQVLINLPEKRLISETSQDFYDWMGEWMEEKEDWFSGDVSKSEMYADFIEENPSAKKWMSVKRFCTWVRKYLEFHKIEFEDARTSTTKVFRFQNIVKKAE